MFSEVVGLIRQPISAVVASDPDKSQTHGLEFTKTIRGEFIRPLLATVSIAKLRKLLKTFSAIFPSPTNSSSSPPPPHPIPSSLPRLLDSTHLQLRGCFLDGTPIETTCITRPKLHLRHVLMYMTLFFFFFFFLSISRYLSQHTLFSSTPSE